MKQRNLIAPVAALFVFMISVIPAAQSDTPQSRATAFVQNIADTVIRELTDSSASRELQEQKFREIVYQHVAVKSIARWVLGGRHWRRASEQQRQRYLALFGDIMVATYAHRFQDYAGETLNVESAQVIDDTQTLVKTTITRPSADRAVKIDWRVRETKGQLRVIDVMVEGLSLAQSQRSEFASFLRANGQSVDALIANLEERLRDARNGRMAEAIERP